MPKPASIRRIPLADSSARVEEAVAAEAAGLESGIDLESWAAKSHPRLRLTPRRSLGRSRPRRRNLPSTSVSRQQELDHREAELNAWAAQLERDTRAAQLWLEERNAELEETAQPAETIVRAG